MLYGYLISNISNAKIDPLFYFTLNVEQWTFIQQTTVLLILFRKLPMVEKHTQVLGFGKNIYIIGVFY